VGVAVFGKVELGANGILEVIIITTTITCSHYYSSL
jgi:hypothetical protein